MKSFTAIAAILLLMTLYRTGLSEGWTQFGGSARDFQLAEPFEMPRSNPTKRWQQQLGAGMSGVVECGGVVFTSYLIPFEDEEAAKPEHERTHREAIVAMNANNGRIVWKHVYDAGWIESQQAFGGRSRAPQATPAICGDRIVAIGFTGKIYCLDRTDGQVIWEKDAVEDFDAVPVQFGFSASPVPLGDKVVMLLGGKSGGGLVCLDLSSGDTIWNIPCGEASYATPVIWDRPEGRQIVITTRNRVVGVDATVGKPLWAYRLPGPGLTNVPTPLTVDDTGLVISGQGIKGTRRLEIERRHGRFVVAETWRSKEQFFYCNWVRKADYLLGCNGNLLLTLDVATGKTVGRYRGYNDANLLMFNAEALVFDGEGRLSTFHIADDGLRAVKRYAVLNERCWTPPTPVGNFLYCRGGDQLMCVQFNGGDPRAAVVSLPVRKKMLALNVSLPESGEPDVMQQIVTAFESGGPADAWKVYEMLRDRDPDAISYQQRRQLAKMADTEGLRDFAKRIEQHMAEDFPKEFAKANRKASTEITRGENGLLYVEFALRNAGFSTIQAVVKGPEKHPFGYGLPIRPFEPRIEKWPVGTKLHRTVLGVRRELLLTVDESFAGKTIDLNKKQ